MKLLLDTCTFIWFNLSAPDLSERAFSALMDPKNEVYLSAVSCWEMTVKYMAGRLPLPESPVTLVPRTREESGIQALPFGEAEALHLTKLPHFHNDPFDRMLVCQALVHGMTLVTSDENIQKYPAQTIW